MPITTLWSTLQPKWGHVLGELNEWQTADHKLLWGLNLEGHNSKAFVMSMLMAHSGGLLRNNL